ncbi:MAG: hypothetical protein ABSC48_09135 [Terracidiphilus sp.]|jgi:hypothetical protein
MDSKQMAEQIADRVLDLEKRVKLWKSLIVKKLQKPIAEVESAFEVHLGELQVSSEDQEHYAQFVKDIHASTDDTALVKTLYEGIFRQSTAGNFHSGS